ncbi:hypothetical protein [Bifidobacterium mongoliense]|uniref:hypothetical protein n=1 Tax=Bifidobacterium mongoliense TaxID=518643 RepID=UPI0030EF7E54
MSARALAPALLDMADAIEAAKSLVSPKSKIELKVQATKEGSFDIQLILQAIGDFANSTDGQAISFLVSIGGVGLVAIIVEAVKFAAKKINKGEPRVVESKPVEADDGTTFSEEKITVEYPDGERVIFHKTAMHIAQNAKFVNSMGKALAGPASQQGVDGAEISSTDIRQNVDSGTARTMAEWEPSEKIVDEFDNRMTVQPVDAHFRTGKRWHVTAGAGTDYVVDIEDGNFLKSVEDGLRMGVKDVFVVNMHTVSSVGRDGKLRSKHTITKVIRHIPVQKTEQGTFDLGTR